MLATWEGRIAVFVATLVVCAASPVAAQATADVSGPWLARNARLSSSAMVSISLDLTQSGDSVAGQISYEVSGGAPTPSRPVRGVVRSDSLFLSDQQGVPVLAVAVSDRRLVGRIAGSPNRMNRNVPNLKELADSQPVRFERP